MEYFDLSKRLEMAAPKVPSFQYLRGMKPLWVTQDLEIWREEENWAYAQELAANNKRVVKVQRKLPQRNFTSRLHFPRRINFEMTSRCNYMCRMCPRPHMVRKKMDMPKDLYQRVLDEIDDFGLEDFYMYQFGESMMHQDFDELLDHINSKNNLGNIWLSTNGELLDAKKGDLLLNSNVHFLNFSLNSVSKAAYEVICPKGNYEKVRKNLKSFVAAKREKKRKKPYIRLQMIEQEFNKGEVDEFINGYYDSADILSVSVLEFVDLKENKYAYEQRERKKLTSCTRVLKNDAYIFSNGVVTLCHDDYEGKFNLGNVYENRLEEIWNGERRKKILDINAAGELATIEPCNLCGDYDL